MTKVYSLESGTPRCVSEAGKFEILLKSDKSQMY